MDQQLLGRIAHLENKMMGYEKRLRELENTPSRNELKEVNCDDDNNEHHQKTPLAQ